VDVRTDMGTAIWYSGDPDRAIREYEEALKDKPSYPQTLFNMGVVKWQGKHDGKAALELWERLLANDPSYPERQKVEAVMRRVRAEMK
jgi:tetratricopeptide (TPR) repeat protein